MLSRLTCLLIKAPIPSGVLRRPDTTGVSREKKKWIHADFVTPSPLGAEISLNTVRARGNMVKDILIFFCCRFSTFPSFKKITALFLLMLPNIEKPFIPNHM